MQGKDEGFVQGKDEGFAQGKGEGLAQGKVAAILAVLGARGIEVDAETRARIAGCRDGAALCWWIGRAAVVTTAREVVASEGDAGARALAAPSGH